MLNHSVRWDVVVLYLKHAARGMSVANARQTELVQYSQVMAREENY